MVVSKSSLKEGLDCLIFYLLYGFWKGAGILCVKKIYLMVLTVAALLFNGRASPFVCATERDGSIAPLVRLGVTYVSVLTLDWSPSAYYEDDLNDMVNLIGEDGWDKKYTCLYRFEIDSLCKVMVKYKGNLRKTKHGTLEVELSESLSAKGNAIIADKRLDKNEDYWTGILSAGIYYLKVPVVVEKPGNPYYEDGWLHNPYLKFDVTARRIDLFGRSGVASLPIVEKPVAVERLGAIYTILKNLPGSKHKDLFIVQKRRQVAVI